MVGKERNQKQFIKMLLLLKKKQRLNHFLSHINFILNIENKFSTVQIIKNLLKNQNQSPEQIIALNSLFKQKEILTTTFSQPALKELNISIAFYYNINIIQYLGNNIIYLLNKIQFFPHKLLDFEAINPISPSCTKKHPHLSKEWIKKKQNYFTTSSQQLSKVKTKEKAVQLQQFKISDLLELSKEYMKKISYLEKEELKLLSIYVEHLMIFFEKQFFYSNKIKAQDLSNTSLFFRISRLFSYTKCEDSNLQILLNKKYKSMLLDSLKNIVLDTGNQDYLFEKLSLIKTLLIALRSIYEYGLLKIKTSGNLVYQTDANFIHNTLKIINKQLIPRIQENKDIVEMKKNKKNIKLMDQYIREIQRIFSELLLHSMQLSIDQNFVEQIGKYSHNDENEKTKKGSLKQISIAKYKQPTRKPKIKKVLIKKSRGKILSSLKYQLMGVLHFTKKDKTTSRSKSITLPFLNEQIVCFKNFFEFFLKKEFDKKSIQILSVNDQELITKIIKTYFLFPQICQQQKKSITKTQQQHWIYYYIAFNRKKSNQKPWRKPLQSLKMIINSYKYLDNLITRQEDQLYPFLLTIKEVLIKNDSKSSQSNNSMLDFQEQKSLVSYLIEIMGSFNKFISKKEIQIMIQILELLWRNNIYILELILSKYSLKQLILIQEYQPQLFINFIQTIIQDPANKTILYQNEFLSIELIEIIKDKIINNMQYFKSYNDYCLITKFINVLIEYQEGISQKSIDNNFMTKNDFLIQQKLISPTINYVLTEENFLNLSKEIKNYTQVLRSKNNPIREEKKIISKKLSNQKSNLKYLLKLSKIELIISYLGLLNSCIRNKILKNIIIKIKSIKHLSIKSIFDSLIKSNNCIQLSTELLQFLNFFYLVEINASNNIQKLYSSDEQDYLNMLKAQIFTGTNVKDLQDICKCHKGTKVQRDDKKDRIMKQFNEKQKKTNLIRRGLFRKQSLQIQRDSLKQKDQMYQLINYLQKYIDQEIYRHFFNDNEKFSQKDQKNFLQNGLLQIILHVINNIQQLSGWEYNSNIEIFNNKINTWFYENNEEFAKIIHHDDKKQQQNCLVKKKKRKSSQLNDLLSKRKLSMLTQETMDDVQKQNFYKNQKIKYNKLNIVLIKKLNMLCLKTMNQKIKGGILKETSQKIHVQSIILQQFLSNINLTKGKYQLFFSFKQSIEKTKEIISKYLFTKLTQTNEENHYKNFIDEIIINNNLCQMQNDKIKICYELQIWPMYIKANHFLINNFNSYQNHKLSLQKLLGILHYVEIVFLEKKTQMDRKLTPQEKQMKEKVLQQISQQIFICLQLGIFQINEQYFQQKQNNNFSSNTNEIVLILISLSKILSELLKLFSSRKIIFKLDKFAWQTFFQFLFNKKFDLNPEYQQLKIKILEILRPLFHSAYLKENSQKGYLTQKISLFTKMLFRYIYEQYKILKKNKQFSQKMKIKLRDQLEYLYLKDPDFLKNSHVLIIIELYKFLLDLNVIYVLNKPQKQKMRINIKKEWKDFYNKQQKLINTFLDFLSHVILSVEILRHGQLIRIYFTKPRKCKFLTTNSQEIFLKRFDPTNREIKYQKFMNQIPIFSLEMDHYQKLFDSNINLFKKYTYKSMYDKITFCITLLICIILLFHAEEREHPYEFSHKKLDEVKVNLQTAPLRIIELLCVVKLLFCGYYLIKYFRVNYSLKCNIYRYKLKKQNKKSTFFNTNIWHSIIAAFEVQICIINFILAIVGLKNKNYSFLIIQLFFIVTFSKKFQLIVSSFIQQLKLLLVTFAFLLILLFIISMHVYYHKETDILPKYQFYKWEQPNHTNITTVKDYTHIQNPCKNTFLQCFFNIFTDGKINFLFDLIIIFKEQEIQEDYESYKGDYFHTFFFNILTFIFIRKIIMSIIFGIIIGSFRKKKNIYYNLGKQHFQKLIINNRELQVELLFCLRSLKDKVLVNKFPTPPLN